jgi:DedD protein
MESPPSPEASEIRRRGRRRLLGAVTLVLLVVVFVPMFLDSEPRPQRAEPSLTIPPKDNAPPLPAPAPAKPTPATVVATAPKLEGFAVQVGAFRDEARLTQARQKLEAAGVVHYTERIEGGGAPITRLRAGPFPTREAAEKARATLQEGQVVPLP